MNKLLLVTALGLILPAGETRAMLRVKEEKPIVIKHDPDETSVMPAAPRNLKHDRDETEVEEPEHYMPQGQDKTQAEDAAIDVEGNVMQEFEEDEEEQGSEGASEEELEEEDPTAAAPEEESELQTARLKAKPGARRKIDADFLSAVVCLDIPAMKFCLGKGANIFVRENGCEKQTCLMRPFTKDKSHAARVREVIEFLLTHKQAKKLASLKTYNATKMTAIHFAAVYGNIGIVELLIKAGADAHAVTSMQRSPKKMCSVLLPKLNYRVSEVAA